MSLPRDEQACANCWYFVEVESREFEGECRYNEAGSWAPVNSEDWCGKWADVEGEEEDGTQEPESEEAA